jgi:hypothetical protein
MSVAQVSRLLGVTEVTVRKLCRAGRFDGATDVPLSVPGGRTKRVWRIPATAVVLLLDENGEYVPRGPAFRSVPT